MYKLQFKLIIYNALTKGVIVLILGILISVFIDDLSKEQLDTRLNDKANIFIKTIYNNEVALEILSKKSFVDYNILKEEYIQIENNSKKNGISSEPIFSTENKIVENKNTRFRIIKYPFNYNGRDYILEIGSSYIAADRLRKTILLITSLSIVIFLISSLILDISFNKLLFAPFYKIIDKKIKKVNDPSHYDYQLIDTTTQDFRSLDENISELMNKINNLIIKEKQFIANVSHELLTPVSILTVRLENILSDESLSEIHSRKIYDSIKTLTRLKSVVNSLLLISKVENQQFKKPDQIIIKDLINEVLEELEDRSDDKELMIRNDIQNEFSFYGNHALLFTLFFNVVNNAIKYNDLKGQIIIKDKTSNEFYSIYLKDTGAGMDKDYIENVFNRFEKLDESNADSHGLGLAIVKSIAQFHKIDIEIQSEIGEGTTFIFRFPSELIS
ncbi:MAG: HAMP domain-containing sensor histidine kinase [Pelobium sp.]